jgi:uncharacterized protein YraI
MQTRRRLAAFALSASLLTGSAVALAPGASAAESRKCNVDTPDGNAVVTRNGVNYRGGPGTTYSSKGLLYRGDTLRTYCLSTLGDHPWYYGKLSKRSRGGLAKNTYGWIRVDMMRET